MNPWELLAWVGAICGAIIVVTLTIAVVVGAVKSVTGKSKGASREQRTTRIV